MRTSPILPGGLRPASVLGVPPTAPKPDKGHRIRLGYPRRCPKTPTLNMYICDDSGSLYGPAGHDPLSNRYGEIRRALEAVARQCPCQECLASIIHFDTPTTGCVEPTPLGRAGLRRLGTGLAVPHDAAGASLLGSSLAKAESLAAQYPEHRLVLTILTDWELFDDNLADLFSRLARFPGKVYAVALRNPLPPGLLDPAVQTVTITHHSPPGSLARATFDSLTIYRQGRELSS